MNAAISESLEWITPTNNVHITPADRTVALVIDLRTNKGAIFIHQQSDGKYVAGVGIEESGNIVIVPWNQDWYYFSIGTVRLAYAITRDAG